MPSITIGIAGGTGAGKTTLARAVYETLGGPENVAYLSHDSYYRDITHLPMEERAQTNFDHPDSLDTELLIRHVQMLKRGESVEVPNYDFSRHARTDAVTVVEPKKVVLVEGILIFSEAELVKELDVKVFVEADSDIRLMRRIARDTVERGRSVDEIMDQYVETVRPMHEEFVEPSKRRADVIVHSLGNDNDGNGGAGVCGEQSKGEQNDGDEDTEGNGDAGSGNEGKCTTSGTVSTSVALKMIVNYLKLEAGIDMDSDHVGAGQISDNGKGDDICDNERESGENGGL